MPRLSRESLAELSPDAVSPVINLRMWPTARVRWLISRTAMMTLSDLISEETDRHEPATATQHQQHQQQQQSKQRTHGVHRSAGDRNQFLLAAVQHDMISSPLRWPISANLSLIKSCCCADWIGGKVDTRGPLCIIIIIIIIKNEKIRVTLCENAAGALYIVNKMCVDGQRNVQG